MCLFFENVPTINIMINTYGGINHEESRIKNNGSKHRATITKHFNSFNH